MHEHMFDEILEKRQTGSVKWDGLKQLFGSDELIPMWVADMDVRPADSITKALTKTGRKRQFRIFPVRRRSKTRDSALV